MAATFKFDLMGAVVALIVGLAGGLALVGKDARKSLRQLNQCCNSFLKSFLHYHHNNG